MKAVLFSGSFFVSILAFGAVQFPNDTLVPAEVQKEISRTVTQKCVIIREMDWAVRELETQVSIVEIDQGLVDTTYLSVFEVDAKQSDSNHSTRFLLKTETVVTDANNGTHLATTILEGCK